MFEDLELCRKEANGKLPDLSIETLSKGELCEIDAATSIRRGTTEMTSADYNSEFLTPYICNDVIGVELESGPKSQESKRREQNLKQRSETVDDESVNPIPRIFAREMEVRDFMDSLSLEEVVSAEHWFRCGVKMAREKWWQKRFQVRKSTFAERIRPFVQEELAEIQTRAKAKINQTELNRPRHPIRSYEH